MSNDRPNIFAASFGKKAALKNGRKPNGLDHAKADAGSPAFEAADGALIQVKAGELHILATHGEAALIESGLPVYQRGKALVQPICRRLQSSALVLANSADSCSD